MNRGRKKEETTAFLGPGWINVGTRSGQSASSREYMTPREPIVEFNVKDQMYTLASLVVNSIDGIWHTYFPGEENQHTSKQPVQAENFLDDFGEWRKANKGEKHPELWELTQAEGDKDWLDWIQNHIWTYIGLSAPLLGAIRTYFR